VDAKNYHVTLAFIGEVAESRLAVLRQVGGSLQAPAAILPLDSLEYWPAIAGCGRRCTGDSAGSG